MSYVAEVWLDWDICRGSTMYRATAKTERGAQLKAKIAAMKLDVLLPKFYMDTDWSGRPCRYAYDFGIKYGARNLTEREEKDGVTAIWTTSLPGTRDFAGEHPDAHPWTEAKLALTPDMGFKL
ncbi:hypothetical protein WJ96_05730 [Burkholderia ubonensis]|uniref:Uncharacterized protein n=1 Tax=Burkholderia ubonensis TaxID=101571 RepID=A0AAW3MW72_9BURK|nr:hypothetical protein [Burkholderia ubonensis]KVP75256.1 hypothetical protein WJ93_07525 [Burkholderia ubonensis]KVP96725.1 hypothetical protein WJ97_12660 [Burkholderia ubonensis]KVP98069.1 hypothetical protein WJ96_05730 [Burkholderia ubonensis]KVZ92766.1 hypothetical protein WL25_17390 [Burkholderia ubonensis]